MLKRYLELKQYLDPTNPQIAVLMPGPAEGSITSNLYNHLQKFESMSKKLQEEDVNLSIARTMFDGILSDFQSENLEKYLGNNSLWCLSSI